MTHQLEVAKRLAQLRRIKQVQQERDISQSELAAVVGTTPESYGRYENGRRKVPDEAIIALAQFYGVTPGYIRYGESDTITVAGLPIDRASLVRFSDAELAEARRQIASEEAQAAEKAALAPEREVGNGPKKRRPR